MVFLHSLVVPSAVLAWAKGVHFVVDRQALGGAHHDTFVNVRASPHGQIPSAIFRDGGAACRAAWPLPKST